MPLLVSTGQARSEDLKVRTLAGLRLQWCIDHMLGESYRLSTEANRPHPTDLDPDAERSHQSELGQAY